MRIRHIEMVGFKSFVDKTRINFHEGISVVVGPNGCGKSNVVDAIRWVMGEMSVKSLRGKDMIDILFSGSKNRKPTSMAQVSLVFSCEDGIHPIGFENVPEIEITRRLYRSGESEYLINRVPCRLKDINEMLMDTGAGSKSYAIIEQGQIAKVLSAKPIDRRVLIEEASGTTKFRYRREETQRKIEATRQNLERLQDLMTEVKRRVISLARQAGKARRHKEFTEEIRTIDLELAARESDEISRKEKELDRVVGGLKDKILGSQNSIAARETQADARQLDHLKAAKALESRREELAEKSGEIKELETRRSTLGREIARYTARIETFESESLKSAEALPEYEKEAEEAAREAGRIADEILEVQSRLADLEGQLGVYRQSRRQTADAAENIRRATHQAAGQLASLNGRIESFAYKRGRDDKKIVELTQILNKLGQESQILREEIERLAVEESQLAAQKAEMKEREPELLTKLGNLKIERNTARENLETVRGRHQAAVAQLESLERMKSNMEGYSEGVRNLFAAVREEGSDKAKTPGGLLGLLGDVIEVGPEYEAALEAVLGDRVQGVLVQGQNEGMEALGFLKAGEAGRSTVIPMQVRPPRAEYPGETLAQSCGPLAQHVQCAPNYAPIVSSLLDNVLLVDDLKTAVRLHNANGYTGSFVTSDGEFVDPYGVITGGSKKALSSGILRNNRRIRVLVEQIVDLEGKLESVGESYRAADEETRRIDEELIELREQYNQVARTLSECEENIRRSRGEDKGLAARRQSVDEQLTQVRDELAQMDDEGSQAAAEVAELDGKVAQLRKELQTHEDALFEGAQKLEFLQEDVTKTTAHLAGLREKKKAALNRETQVRWALTRTQEDLDRRSLAIAEDQQLIVVDTGKLTAIEEEMAGKTVAAAEFENALNRDRISLTEGEETHAEAESQLRVMRRDLDALTQELNRSELSVIELRMKRDGIISRLVDKYGMDLSDLPEEYGKDDSIDAATLYDRRKHLAEKIAAIGEVNLSAIEEHTEESERLEFFTKQKEDLEMAIGSLERAIARINHESIERFTKTFELVAEKFAEVIPTLFGGGQAHLELTEPDKPLESGVEISVRPPGKKLRNINLLSGGEKALASIGLIFSIFLIKSSPFCFLDEVDAPLDDVNIDRFNEMIQMIREHSQVIVITHNKRTMNISECLYGVSMEEAGVSKLVGVKFDGEDGIDCEDDTTQPLEAAAAI